MNFIQKKIEDLFL